MTLLSVVWDVCDTVGFPRPVSVVTATDALSKQVFALARTEVRELSRKNGWPVLQRDYTFATVAGQSQYALPSDFESMLNESMYNTGNYWKVRGSVTPEEWQLRKRLLLSSLSTSAFRIFGSPAMLNIQPTPTTVQSLTFEYVSNGFVKNSLGAVKPTYTEDADVSVVDETLVQMGLLWRVRKAKGLEYGADKDEYDMAVKRELSKALANPPIEVGKSSVVDPVMDSYISVTLTV